MTIGRPALLLLASSTWALAARAATPATPPVSTARVTILSTMLADSINDEKTFVGEWGFSAVVEANGQRVLFDTGASGDAVLRNAAVLGIDLSSITDVIVSHFHEDHAGGLPGLRRELASKNPAALSRAHVLRGFFWRARRRKESRTGRSTEPAPPTRRRAASSSSTTLRSKSCRASGSPGPCLVFTPSATTLRESS